MDGHTTETGGAVFASIHCAHVLDPETVRVVRTGRDESGSYEFVQGTCTRCQRFVRQMEYGEARS